MSDLTRPLSVRFTTRHYSRLGHGEILESLEDTLELSDVKAIQITETSCFVTLTTREAKERLLTSGIDIRNQFNSVYDVDKIVTNVTIKDAPFELSDTFLLEHLKVYGDVIENSLRRGKIRGTDIETGTRYLQMINVKEVLPVSASLGRFKVRLYSDNKTECRLCKDVGHPFYRCPKKTEQAPRACGRCKSSTHQTRDCTNEIVCNYCDQSGHKQKDCDEYLLMKARKSYGEYAAEILEGRRSDGCTGLAQSSVNDPPIDATARQPEPAKKTLVFDDDEANDINETGDTKNSEKDTVDNTEGVQTKGYVSTAKLTPKFTLVSDVHINFVLGDSNAVRLHVKDPDVRNISIQGQKAANVDTLLSIAEDKAHGKAVKRIVMHLGTNDVSKCRADSSQGILDISISISETHKKFPDAEIAFSSILPRRGKTAAIKTLNDTATVVNDYVKKLAKKEPYLYYIDNDSDFLDNGIPIKALYDSSDTTGTHVSDKGADILTETFQDFFNTGQVSYDDFSTPATYKRNRSALSNTPPSDKQVSKTNKMAK